MRWWVLGLLVVSACARSPASFDQARRAAASGDWDAAVRYYERALSEDPQNLEIRIALRRAFLEASRAHLDRARAHLKNDDLAGAVEELEAALEYDPTNRYALDLLKEHRANAARSQVTARPERVGSLFGSEPVLDPSSSDPLTLYFPEGTSLRTVLESLAELAGVSILFDESFRDQRVSVDLQNVTFQQALDILMQTNGLFYKVVSSSRVIVTDTIP